MNSEVIYWLPSQEAFLKLSTNRVTVQHVFAAFLNLVKLELFKDSIELKKLFNAPIKKRNVKKENKYSNIITFLSFLTLYGIIIMESIA
ncbi:hypothetical protein I532_24512 [Brevibacillus borstelensis AK1]|uniref:Uncharacterized protein n=1 Tax=Brevibacillus borstelensis AK1 TaxID=1300222 RepID=M8D9H3_9BACL|nr:hypothetical protein I532_24512 [Brevibacillus borstelensis AK1]